MKFDLKRPCANCPFRTDSLSGWLGGNRASEIAPKSPPVVKVAPTLSPFASREEAALFLLFIVQSPYWNLDMNNATALEQVKQFALESATSNEQRALVKAAISKIETTS